MGCDILRPRGEKRFKCMVRIIGASWIVKFLSAMTGFLHLNATSEQVHGLIGFGLLFAFVFICSFQGIDFHKVVESFFEARKPTDI